MPKAGLQDTPIALFQMNCSMHAERDLSGPFLSDQYRISHTGMWSQRKVKERGRNGGGGGRREAGFGGFPTPARALGSRGGKYLPLRGRLVSRRRHRLPVIGLEMVEVIKLEADILDGELQQVPETSQVLRCGPRIGVHILAKRGTGKHNEYKNQV